MGRRLTIIALAFLLLLAVSCSKKPVEIKPLYSDLAEAQKVAAEAGKPLLIDFWSDT